MSNLFDLLLAGLATGAIYAIVAVGFTLLWQTSQTINFAQGEFVMLPAFLMLAAMHAGAPFWLAILIGILLSLLLLGLGFKMLLVDPMLRHGVLPLAIATAAGTTIPGVLLPEELSVPDPSLRKPWGVTANPSTTVSISEVP